MTTWPAGGPVWVYFYIHFGGCGQAQKEKYVFDCTRLVYTSWWSKPSLFLEMKTPRTQPIDRRSCCSSCRLRVISLCFRASDGCTSSLFSPLLEKCVPLYLTSLAWSSCVWLSQNQEKAKHGPSVGYGVDPLGSEARLMINPVAGWTWSILRSLVTGWSWRWCSTCWA